MILKGEATKRQLIGMMVIVSLFVPVFAFAGAALETVKGHADRVLEVLRDPSLKAARCIEGFSGI